MQSDYEQKVGTMSREKQDLAMNGILNRTIVKKIKHFQDLKLRRFEDLYIKGQSHDQTFT